MAEPSTVDAKSHNEAYPTKAEAVTPFRLHYSDGSREGLPISKVKVIKEVA